EPITDAGLWSVFIPNAKNGDKYKFVVSLLVTTNLYLSPFFAFGIKTIWNLSLMLDYGVFLSQMQKMVI
ncbi:early set domain-containing protein, partial [Francisella tularensis]|uniref:hypothetical protein n=1 Tax=Francisella tularensis TaxID=263 RepID=UPI000CB8D363